MDPDKYLHIHMMNINKKNKNSELKIRKGDIGHKNELYVWNQSLDNKIKIKILWEEIQKVF